MQTLRAWILVLSVLVAPALAVAGDLTIRPRFPDLFPGDGLFEPGSPSTPYELRRPHGNRLGTITPRYPNLFPDSGLFRPGTLSNPYELHLDEKE